MDRMHRRLHRVRWGRPVRRAALRYDRAGDEAGQLVAIGREDVERFAQAEAPSTRNDDLSGPLRMSTLVARGSLTPYRAAACEYSIPSAVNLCLGRRRQMTAACETRTFAKSTTLPTTPGCDSRTA